MSVRALFAAETVRATLRPQTRRAIGLGLTSVCVLVALSISQGTPGSLANGLETLEGIHAVIPLSAAALGILYTGNWWTTGTAMAVSTWVERRWIIPATECAAASLATGGVCAAVIVVAATSLAARAVAAGSPVADAAATLASPVLIAVGAALASSLLGSAVGIAVRSSAGGALMLFGLALFGEPLIHTATSHIFGPATAWLMPTSAVTALAGVALVLAPEGGPNPWLVTGAWTAGVVAVGTIRFVRSDLA